MKPIEGLLHETSVQAARARQTTFSAAPTIGQKRNRSDGDAGPNKQPLGPNARGEIRFQRAISIPQTSSRLRASNIVNLVENPGASEWSQRLIIAATPTATHDPELSLSHRTYDLPTQLVHNFASLGITQMYPWQKSCLKGPGLLNGEKNLVYCAPTGGGKSLVADLLMLKRILSERGAKALLVLPYVALVQEKVHWLRRVVEGLQKPKDPAGDENDLSNMWRRRPDQDMIRVVGFIGGGRVRATWADFDIGVCTMEKANGLVNTAIDECTISTLRAVVLDELHMIDDGHRGYLLELITTKLLSLDQNLQIVAMSATLPNIDCIGNWIDGHAYETKYRPVPIHEFLVYEGNIYSASSTGNLITTAGLLTRQTLTGSLLEPTRRIESSAHRELNDPVLNAVITLAHETAVAGHGALVFASSRGMCESDAQLISRVMPQPHEVNPQLLDERLDLLNELRSLNTGIDAILEETVLLGVAFHRQSDLPILLHTLRKTLDLTHHADAGLTVEERDLIANAYDAGTILVCVATCSLAAGINLPARRVILHGARMGREFVGPALLRQMRGRAGRQGKAPVGETFLCCRKDDLDEVVQLMHAELPEVRSSLAPDNRRLQRALLEVISIRLAISREGIRDHFAKSLLRHTHGMEYIDQCLDSSFAEIEQMGFVTRDAFLDYNVTQLGKAIVASGIDPDDGIFIHRELSRALRAFVMDGDLHILYTFTPVQNSGLPVNWQVFRNEMEKLDESGLRVLSFLSIKPTVVMRLAQGATLKESTPEEKDVAKVYRRFYLALQLRDICNEVPIHVVARKYDVPRGMVQNLSQTCQGFAAGMIKFCEQMGWGVMAAALDHFTDRLMAGARMDLLELAKVTFIKSRTARVFWESGFRTVASLANANPSDLVPVLMQAQPNKLRLKESSKDNGKYEGKLLAKAEVISASANKIWQSQIQAQVGVDEDQ